MTWTGVAACTRIVCNGEYETPNSSEISSSRNWLGLTANVTAATDAPLASRSSASIETLSCWRFLIARPVVLPVTPTSALVTSTSANSGTARCSVGLRLAACRVARKYEKYFAWDPSGLLTMTIAPFMCTACAVVSRR